MIAAAEAELALNQLNGKRDGVTFNVGAIDGGGEGAELIIDGDTDTLESLGRRVRPAGTRGRRGGFGHEFSEGRCAGETTRTAGGLDGVNNPVPARLLAEIADGLLQLAPVSAF